MLEHNIEKTGTKFMTLRLCQCFMTHRRDTADEINLVGQNRNV